MLCFFEDGGDGFCERSVFLELHDLSLLRFASMIIVVAAAVMATMIAVLVFLPIVVDVLFRGTNLRIQLPLSPSKKYILVEFACFKVGCFLSFNMMAYLGDQFGIQHCVRISNRHQVFKDSKIP